MTSAVNALRLPGPFFIAFQTRNAEKQQAVGLVKKVLREFLERAHRSRTGTSQKKFDRQTSASDCKQRRYCSTACINRFLRITTFGDRRLSEDYREYYRERCTAIVSTCRRSFSPCGRDGWWLRQRRNFEAKSGLSREVCVAEKFFYQSIRPFAQPPIVCGDLV